MKRGGGAATAAFLLLCAAWYGWRSWYLQMPDRGPSDFQFYYLAAQHVWHGRSPYLEGGYVYPPLAALLFAPLTVFDYYTARWIWFVASHAIFLWAGWLLWRRAGGGRTALCAIALVWAAGGAAEEGFGLGQLDAALVGIAVAAIAGRGWIRRAAVAGGFALKFFPGILALVERRWRGIGATALLSAGLMALPWAVVRVGLKGPAAPPNTQFLAGTPCVLSWSVPSLALRFADWPQQGKLPQDWTFGYDLPKLKLTEVERAVSMLAAAILLLAGLAAWARAAVQSDVASGAALMCLAVTAAPVSWWHYPVLEYPAIAILLIVAAQERRWGLAAAALAAGAGTYLVPAAVLRHYYHLHEAWPDSPWLIQFWTAVPAVSALILFGLLRRASFHTVLKK